MARGGPRPGAGRPRKGVVTVAVSLPREVAEDTRAEAERRGQSVSGWVAEALRQRLRRRRRG